MQDEAEEDLKRQGYAVARFGGQTLVFLDPKRLKFKDDKTIAEMCKTHFPLEELAKNYQGETKFPNLWRCPEYVQIELPAVIFYREFTRTEVDEYNETKYPAVLHAHYHAPETLAKLLII